VVIIGTIAALLSGCVATTSAGSSRPSATPTPTPTPTTATDDPLINSARFPRMSAAQVCALVTPDEATALLGGPIEQPPGGISEGGYDADCVYQVGEIVVVGEYLKVDFNRLGFSGEATLVNLQRGAHTLEVGGYEAIGAEAETDPLIEEAVLSVRLAKSTTDPALWIEAPTSVIAEHAADLILPRLAALP